MPRVSPTRNERRMKHRKKIRHRHIAIAATAVAAIAIPSVAVAGGSWTGQEQHPHQEEAQSYGWPTPPSTSSPEPSTSASSSPSTSPSAASTSSPSPDVPAARERVVELVNAERRKAGCGPVTANDKLTTAGQRHSEDMAARQEMTHTGSDGSDAGDRIARTGYQANGWAENVAYYYSTPERVMKAWMNSRGHRENILNCYYQEIGVGLAQPGNYWTQNFSTPH